MEFDMKVQVLILMLILSMTSFAQTNGNEPQSSGRVHADKPMADLDYVCQDKSKVYLRMNNNTSWVLAVKSDQLYYYTRKKVKLLNGKEFYAMPNDKGVSLQYRVEKFALPWENVKVPKLAQPDSGSLNWIASEDSILFSVPIEYLRKDLQVSVRFNYEWEMTKQGFFETTPEHRVSFRGIDIPDTPALCKETIEGRLD